MSLYTTLLPSSRRLKIYHDKTKHPVLIHSFPYHLCMVTIHLSLMKFLEEKRRERFARAIPAHRHFELKRIVASVRRIHAQIVDSWRFFVRLLCRLFN